MTAKLIHADCMELLPRFGGVDCIFADPPDNIGLQYVGYNDARTQADYYEWLGIVLGCLVKQSPVVWLSYNSKHTIEVCRIVHDLLAAHLQLKSRFCVQTYTFGQHNSHDLGCNYRPLLRLKHDDAPLYPDQIRVPSWRQQHGDKRANPGGKVPGDVFDFPRVTGNSKQRRKWYPTQLHEGLVERCLKLTTKPGDTVLDPFAGTGTVARVCRRINRNSISMEISDYVCQKISEELGVPIEHHYMGASHVEHHHVTERHEK